MCPVGTVKSPNEDGVEWATCESARLVCGTAQVSKYGSCSACPSTQVAVDDVKCANCPLGYTKTPSGVVSDASCKRVTCVPHSEICNGKDDNCNGQVDEGLGTLSCGRGACAATVPKCLAGRTQTCKPKPASKEVCDGIDNDCDGQVDEGLADLYCTPCNIKVPSCIGGKPRTCAGVCALPCCEDCASYANPADKATCYSNCQNCRNEQDCLAWADSVADQVAEAACNEAAYYCGILQPTKTYSNQRQVTALQCYYGAYDTCTSRGQYYMMRSATGSCAFYYKGGGSCTMEAFQSRVAASLDQICHDVSLNIAVALP